MALNVYLYFNGNCREAVEFYAKVFKAEKPRIMTYGDAPRNRELPLPEEAKNLVIHAQLNLDGSNVMFSDVYPGSPFVAGNNISITLVKQNIDEVKSIFTLLREGGSVGMELQETFWSKCYGQLTDKYGVHWQLSYDNGEMEM